MNADIDIDIDIDIDMDMDIDIDRYQYSGTIGFTPSLVTVIKVPNSSNLSVCCKYS
jgi:hypothetical protein